MNKKLLPFIISLTLGSVSTLAGADSLNEVYQLALSKDPQVLRAAAVVDSNKEGIVQARSSLFPQITFSTSASKSFSEGSRNVDFSGTPIYYPSENEDISTGYSFQLSQEVFSMATWQNLDNAEKTALQSEVNHTLAKQNLISRVTQVYFDILKAQDGLELARAENKAIERQLEQTNQRFKVGLTAITDVHEAQAQFDTSVATVIRTQNDVEIQKELLREITGQYHNQLSVLNTERFSTAKLEKSATDWVNLAQTNNQELQAQTISMDIAKNNIDRAFSGHLPTVSMSASLGRSNTNASESTLDAPQDVLTELRRPRVIRDNPTPTDSKSIGISVSVPIFSGFATESGVKQAQANYVVASEDRELAYRRIVRTVRTSYANVLTLVSTIKAQEQALVSAESALKATEAGFEVGTRTIVDVLESTQNLFSAKRTLSSSRYDYIMAVLNLKLAAGTVSEADVNAINKGLMN
jgi:outer membrane protein